MTNLVVRRTRGQPPRHQIEGDPFHWMQWDPLRLRIPFWSGKEQPAHFVPDFEIRETKDGFVFKADLPGVKEKDLEITVTGNHLTIRGKREAETEENTDTYFTRGCSHGGFTRTFTLPEGTDPNNEMLAELNRGVLMLFLPKRPAQKPRRIEVKASDELRS